VSLRDEMPIVAEFIDECRKAFGTEMVNTQIKLGMQGAETFYASKTAMKSAQKLPRPRYLLLLIE
jgi:hypothetical protein